jgi:hypothetical protein
MDQPRYQAGGTSVPQPSVEQPLVAPHGLEQILTTFGDIYKYIRPDGSLDPRWQADFLEHVALPFPLLLSWDRSKSVRQITCHKLMTVVFAAVFARIQERGLQAKIRSFGGCFAFRSQRTGTKLSAHSWGIAIDLNPESNAQGSVGDMDAGVIEIFRDARFAWGGDWEGRIRDPMHFQFCTGY